MNASPPLKNFPPPKVSIITLNWNTPDLTCQLIDSLKSYLTYENVEIIVVDNGSIIDPTNLVKAIIPEVLVIRNSTNLGFSKGCNIGMQVASGDYLFLLNSDTEITPGLLELLVDSFKSNSEIGIVSPRVHSLTEKNKVEYTGYSSVHPITGRSSIYHSLNVPHGVENGLYETQYAYGAAMMISRQVYEQVGGICEDYFAYYEELDWSNRIREKGFKVYCNTTALVYHKGSASTVKINPFKTFLMTRNRILFMKRNVNWFNYYLFMIYFILLVTPKQIVSYLVKLQFKNIQAFFNGLNYHLTNKKNYLFKICENEYVHVKSMS